MDGLGLLVVMAFIILILVIMDKQSCPNLVIGSLPNNEGFSGESPYWDSYASKPQVSNPTQPTLTVPVVGPAAANVTKKKEPAGYTGVSDLPSAPVANLGEVNSLPFQDPRFEKVSTQMLRQLKQDMDGFSANEMPHLKDRSDPAVRLPLTRFQGDYQRIKDELTVVDRTPGFQSQLAVEDLNEMAANLRFLQRTYRLYAANEMVPAPEGGLSKVGVETDIAEGFVTKGVTTTTTSKKDPSPTNPSYPSDPANKPISVAELSVLRQKIAVEILRLQASGTTDPVLQARVNVFKKIQTAVEDIAKQVEDKTMRPEDIPIKKRDYEKFLPALGDQSAGVAGLLSKSGYPSLSSLFNAYDRGDVTGTQMTEDLFKFYADTLLQGTSYKLDISYTSPNEVAARQAEATKAAADLAAAAWPQAGVGNQVFAGLSGAFQTAHPMTSDGARGAFDAYTRQLDMQNFQGDLNFGSQGLPDGSYQRQSVMPNSAQAASFDWKARAQTICENVKKMGLNPADFGCQANPQGSAQNTDFSWRGYAKMVCNRLKTVADTGVPEQVGCPPDSWKGWRT